VDALERAVEGNVEVRRDVLNLPVLLLNRFFAPVSVTTARRALVLLYGGIGHAVDTAGDTYDFSLWRNLPVRGADDALPIVGGALRVPRVLHLLRYDRTPRDEAQCQYCSRRPGNRELNVDHVLPRSRGGEDSWTNLVISCRSCNLKKGRRTPAEAGMKLLNEPKRPRWSTARQILMVMREPFAEWQPFLKAG
jgi:hypothetical protein